MNYLKTNDKIAIDTNILVYATLNQDEVKKEIALEILTKKPMICDFVLFELIGVLRKKDRKKYNKSINMDILINTLKITNYAINNEDVIYKAKDLMNKYNLQLKDSLIMSSFLLSGCEIFYSEDGHHNLLIDKKMRIINPFK